MAINQFVYPRVCKFRKNFSLVFSENKFGLWNNIQEKFILAKLNQHYYVTLVFETPQMESLKPTFHCDVIKCFLTIQAEINCFSFEYLQIILGLWYMLGIYGFHNLCPRDKRREFQFNDAINSALKLCLETISALICS